MIILNSELHLGQKAPRDRFIPYQGTKHDMEISQYLFRSTSDSHKGRLTPYQKELTEVCSGMDIREWRKRTVLLMRPPVYLDHALSGKHRRQYAEIMRTEEAAQILLKPRAPNLCCSYTVSVDELAISKNTFALSRQHLLAIGMESSILIKDIRSKKNSPYFLNNSDRTSHVQSVSWSDAGRKLIAGVNRGSIDLWDVEKQASYLVYESPTPSFFSLASSHETSPILYAGSDKGRIFKIDVRLKKAVVQKWRTIEGRIHEMAVSPDQNYLVSGHQGMGVCLWDLKGGNLENPLAMFGEDYGYMYGLAFHENSSCLATGTEWPEDWIHVWSLQYADHPQLVSSLKARGEICSLDWAGNRLFTSYGDAGDYTGFVETYKMSKNYQLVPDLQFAVHQDSVIASQLYSDRKKLVTLGLDDQLKVWDISLSLPGLGSLAPKKSTSLSTMFSIR